MSYIKTKTEDASLIVVDNELYLSNNLDLPDGENDEKEIAFQISKDGRALEIYAGSSGRIELNDIQFGLLKQYLNNSFNS